MHHKTISILSTRPVNTAVDGMDNVQLDILSFIETEPVKDKGTTAIVRDMGQEEQVTVFTSMNAVEAVKDMLGDSIPSWKVYCMGHTTRQLVNKYFGEEIIAGTGNDATELAETVIAARASEEVLFFCGDQRRDELPDLLTRQGIRVKEIIVYKTNQIPHRVHKQYDGILFFSPSAVHSFFAVNQVAMETVLFAIGQTTANTIQRYCNNQVITADKPGKEALLQKAILYCKQ